MTRKSENYNLWKLEQRERKHQRNIRRRNKRKAKKEANRTWKCGCIIVLKTLDANRKPVSFVCRMKKRPDGINAHICAVCNMMNNGVPCLKITTDTHKKCDRKRSSGVFPFIIGRFDKHGKYHEKSKL